MRRAVCTCPSGSLDSCTFVAFPNHISLPCTKPWPFQEDADHVRDLWVTPTWRRHKTLDAGEKRLGNGSRRPPPRMLKTSKLVIIPCGPARAFGQDQSIMRKKKKTYRISWNKLS